MKKITFILLALISGVSFAQSSADGTATVNAEIVSPIKIENQRGLSFGRLIGSTDAGGIVKIAADANGTRTLVSGNNDILAPDGNITLAPQSAHFTINAETGYTFDVSLSDLSEISFEGNSMPITFQHSLDADGNSGSENSIDMYLGGELTVGASQAPGMYTGEVTVTVSYE
jgi:hypothetical protein